MVPLHRSGIDLAFSGMTPFAIKDADPRKVPLLRHTLAILAEWQAVAPEGTPYILLTAARYERALARWRKLGRVDAKWRSSLQVVNVLRDFRSHAKRA
jgi:hypothetical protein